jgi:uncharacterized FAD-dependent dehydrogenase
MQKYDVGIIGAGVSGVFAASRAAEQHKDKKVILFDLGRPQGKRRRQIEGFLGCFPTSDGKIYVNDIDQILNVVDGRRANPANNWVLKKLGEVNPMKVIKDKLPTIAIQKKIEAANFELQLNDYIQWKPESIHQLSKILGDEIDAAGNITFSFDNEVTKILKQKSGFLITTAAEGDIFCKKIVLCVGRSGWRWVTKLYQDFGIVTQDNIASYGITIEMSSSHLKDFNKSHCFLQKQDMEVGPFCWNGTVIPEDHADLVISAFRSNEDRWKSDKVSFQLIGYRNVKQNEGIYQTDRLGKLAFLLFNDRVGKEKVKLLLKGECPLSQLPEYDWLKDSILELSEIMPAIISKANFHTPTVLPMAAEIRLDSNLESEVEDLFVAGESANFRGILAAATSGTIAMDSACK